MSSWDHPPSIYATGLGWHIFAVFQPVTRFQMLSQPFLTSLTLIEKVDQPNRKWSFPNRTQLYQPDLSDSNKTGPSSLIVLTVLSNLPFSRLDSKHEALSEMVDVGWSVTNLSLVSKSGKILSS